MGFLDSSKELGRDIGAWVKSWSGCADEAEKGHKNFSTCNPATGTETCPFAENKGKFWLEVTVATRLGRYPLRGVTIDVSGSPMGKTDKKGGFADGSKDPVRKAISNSPFFVTARYESTFEKLKKEDIRVMFLDVDIPAGKLAGKVSWKVLKAQEVAGTGDESLDEKVALIDSDVEVSVRQDLIGWIVSLHIPVATFSLRVPYINQNIGDEYLMTIPGKDPEVVPAQFGPFKGFDLCFPSSLTMVLNYWSVSVTRKEVLQKSYELFAKENFKDTYYGFKRIDCSVKSSSTEPRSPQADSYWLDTSNASRSVLKQAKYATAADNKSLLKWEAIPDKRWRVGSLGGPCCWQYHKRARTLLNALKPNDGDSPDIESWSSHPVPVTYRADLNDPDGVVDHYAALLQRGWPFVVGTNATGSGHIMTIRGAVVNVANKLVFLIANDPYGNLMSINSVVEAPDLSGSVGFGGDNNTEDVAAIQEILHARGFLKSSPDGKCAGADTADPTVLAIAKYQKTHKLVDSNEDGGLIRPDDKTTDHMGQLAKGGYEKGEINAVSGDNGELGRHVYYNCNTLAGGKKQLRFGGKGRGCSRIEKNLTYDEIVEKLVAGL